jgi:hypothetical protein
MTRPADVKPFAQLLSQRVTRRRILAAGASLAPLALASGGLLQGCTTSQRTSGLSF